MTTNMVSGQVKNGRQSSDTKIVMLGAIGVGKSALVVRYLTKRFIWEYDPTLECNYRHSTTIDDEAAVLEILDTAGGQENAAHLEGNMRWGDGFLLVYSVIERQSFQQIRLLKQRLDELRKARNVSCVIVGNKTDLQYGREVSLEEGESLAAELGCAFYETSACDGGSNIYNAFHELYREVRRRRLLEGKTRRRSSAQQVKQVLNKVFTKIQNS